jgi:peptidoglycan hydrolase-like protein with peptidoglycan-binding domain
MDLALLLFGLFWAAFGGRGSSPAPPSSPAPAPGGPPAPWPSVTPTGLPPFPGSGWEYDEPPPRGVQARARQLLSALWAQGEGTSKIEKTDGRWIAYRAEITRGNKRGVVAYRERTPARPETAAVAPLRPPVKAVPTNASPRQGPPAPRQGPPAAPPRQGPIVTPTTQLELPTLRVGAGMPPAAPVPDVRLLQNKLGVAPDGRFGNGTLAAVKEFQRRRGLDVDGVVGPRTWTALFAVRS